MKLDIGTKRLVTEHDAVLARVGLLPHARVEGGVVERGEREGERVLAGGGERGATVDGDSVMPGEKDVHELVEDQTPVVGASRGREGIEAGTTAFKPLNTGSERRGEISEK